MRALEPWVVAPLQTFLAESAARLTLLMTSSGQVVAQHGFSRSLDVMTAAALGAGIVASTEELARLMGASAVRGAGAPRAAGRAACSPPSPRRGAGGSAWWCSDRRRRWDIVQLFFDQMVQRARRGGAAGAAARPPMLAGKLRARARREPQSALRTVAGMSLVNYTTREITCKIVYYGPGRSGKTTNLQYVYGQVPESRRGRMVSLATQTDRTLFFDFLPLELGTISGFTTKFQLYTVPGQIYYNATRKLVLQGADGVVFVADSQARRFDENLESLQNLQANLLAQGVDIRQLPLVFQYNKQDLPRDLILPQDEMDDALNFRAVPSFAADALHGPGVFETLRGISELVLKRLAAGSAGRVTVTLNPLYRFDTLVVGCGQPAGRHRGQGRGRVAGHGVQPALHLRPPGAGQDAPADGASATRPGRINPRLDVEYLTLDEFVEAFHAAIAAGQGEAYRKRFLDVDLLLVDDVQFLTHRREMQAELLRLIDALQTTNRQIVLTSDRPPAEIEALDERLIRRFAGGLIIDIARPRLRDPGGDPPAEGGGAAGQRSATACSRRSRALDDRQRARAARRAQSAGRLPGGERHARSMPEQARCWSAGAGRRTERPRGRGSAPTQRRAAPSQAGPPGGRRRRTSSTISCPRSPPPSPSRSMRGAPRSARPILRWEGEGYRTGRLEALLAAGDGATIRSAALREFEARRRAAPDAAGGGRGAGARRWPARPRFATRTTSPARGGAARAGPRGGASAAGAAPRSGGWTTWSRAPATGGARRPRGPSSRSRAAATTRWSSSARAASGRPTCCTRSATRSAERCSGPVACLSAPEFTGELIEAIDRDAVGAWRARYRRARRLPARRRAPRSPRRTGRRTSCSCSSTS